MTRLNKVGLVIVILSISMQSFLLNSADTIPRAIMLVIWIIGFAIGAHLFVNKDNLDGD